MERNEEKELLNYRFPPPRYLSILMFGFLAIIAIPLTICRAVIWFGRWILRAFMANLNLFTYLLPAALGFIVALALVILFFNALYL